MSSTNVSKQVNNKSTMRTPVKAPDSPAASDASSTERSIDMNDYDDYKESVEAQLEAGEEAVAALETQVTQSALRIRQLEAALAKAERQVTRMEGKLEVREQPLSVLLQKEELLQDMTGLVISSITPERDGTLFNCIHTGLRGTLNYTISKPKSREDSILYTPMLDEVRDVYIRAALPSYMWEPMLFEQDQISGFMQCLFNAINGSGDKKKKKKQQLQ